MRKINARKRERAKKFCKRLRSQNWYIKATINGEEWSKRKTGKSKKLRNLKNGGKMETTKEAKRNRT